MRYRAVTGNEEFSRDVSTFVDFIGAAEYQDLLWKIGHGLRNKGYVLPAEDLKFSLERELFGLEKFRVACRGEFPTVPKELHNATSFLIGLGQTIPHLSEAAQKRLRGRLIGGLKTDGLTSLNHEMRVAALLNTFGCDVNFHDFETGSGFDFLATKDSTEYEVEVKSVSTYSGAQSEPEALEHFHVKINKGFHAWQDNTTIPIFTIKLKNFLENKTQTLDALVAAVNEAALTKSIVELPQAEVSFIGAIADTTRERVKLAMQVDCISFGAWTSSKTSVPKCIVRVVQNRGHKIYEKIERNIREAARDQCTLTRPAIIWVHIEFTTPEFFDSLAGPSAERGAGLDKITLKAFNSAKRGHLKQLIFSGGSFLQADGNIYRSSFKRVVYDAPYSTFKSPEVFPDGKKLVER
jgi:hypothetical protein